MLETSPWLLRSLFGSEVDHVITGQDLIRQALAGLTTKERQVLCGLAAGRDRREVARTTKVQTAERVRQLKVLALRKVRVRLSRMTHGRIVRIGAEEEMPVSSPGQIILRLRRPEGPAPRRPRRPSPAGWVDSATASELTGLTRTHLTNYIVRKGYVRCRRAGHRWLLRRADLLRYARKQPRYGRARGFVTQRGQTPEQEVLEP